ncbi:helix-turn-helix domain-containing protein [Haloarchaeobius sp. FL176]|uniref:helix-turn-helix domain-containing protein n=1 Tax=Haloarchaeobius sp. FL176 TaxID=2967129 RepID=UPI0021479EB2|nr:helix-turn-helix domain-containing protein [Haloarchaeobius sp. FL176]
MGVIAEFSVDTDTFGPASACWGESDVQLQFEQVVPTSGDVAPYVWVSGDTDSFERSMDEATTEVGYSTIDRQGGSVLYRLRWDTDPTGLLSIFVDTDAAVLEARATESWFFRVRFPDESSVTRFHERTREHGYELDLHRLGRSDDRPESGEAYDLTPEQREAMMFALETGYFDIPRQSTLEDIANEFGISNQAASERLRRATATVLEASLTDGLDKVANSGR